MGCGSFGQETKNDSEFDCLVPVSGGKDGTYVTHQLINKYNLKPLCITVKPAMELKLGFFSYFSDFFFYNFTYNNW